MKNILLATIASLILSACGSEETATASEKKAALEAYAASDASRKQLSQSNEKLSTNSFSGKLEKMRNEQMMRFEGNWQGFTQDADRLVVRLTRGGDAAIERIHPDGSTIAVGRGSVSYDRSGSRATVVMNPRNEQLTQGPSVTLVPGDGGTIVAIDGNESTRLSRMKNPG